MNTENVIGGGLAGAGIVGILLWWLLFKYIPRKDAQMERIVEANSKHRDYQSDRHKEAIVALAEKSDEQQKDQRVVFLAALDRMGTAFTKTIEALELRSIREAEACDKRHQGMLELIERVAVKLEELSYEIDISTNPSDIGAPKPQRRGPYSKNKDPKT